MQLPFDYTMEEELAKIWSLVGELSGMTRLCITGRRSLFGHNVDAMQMGMQVADLLRTTSGQPSARYTAEIPLGQR
jgi:hypothetical protein